MLQAKESLDAASRQAQSAAPGEPAQSDAKATLQSQQSLRLAEQALRDQAAVLKETIHQANQNKENSQSPNDASSTANTPKNNSLLSPQEMAKMLDELDKQLNSTQSDANSQATKTKPSTPSDSPQASKSGQAGEPSDAAADERAQTLADAAQRLSAEMNQQRQAMESSAKTMPDTGALTRNHDRKPSPVSHHRELSCPSRSRISKTGESSEINPPKMPLRVNANKCCPRIDGKLKSISEPYRDASC